MKKRNLVAVGALLTGLGGVAFAQFQITGPLGARQSTKGLLPDSPEKLGAPARPLSDRPPSLLDIPIPPQPPAQSKPDDLTIDQLIGEVKKFREQKAELEKKEQACLKALQSKAAKQKEQIDSLIGPTVSPAPRDTLMNKSSNVSGF